MQRVPQSSALYSTFEARKDRFGLLLDGLYIRLTDSMTTPGAAFGDVNGTVTQQLYSAAVAYRVSTAPVTVDALGGLRYTDLRVGLELTQGLLAGRSGEAHENWLDFVDGVRAAAPIGSDWSVIGHFDVGGGRSSTTWQAIVGANFAINPGFGLKVGYRYLSVDYDTDEFLYDMATKGPYLGVGIRF